MIDFVAKEEQRRIEKIHQILFPYICNHQKGKESPTKKNKGKERKKKEFSWFLDDQEHGSHKPYIHISQKPNENSIRGSKTWVSTTVKGFSNLLNNNKIR